MYCETSVLSMNCDCFFLKVHLSDSHGTDVLVQLMWIHAHQQLETPPRRRRRRRVVPPRRSPPAQRRRPQPVMREDVAPPRAAPRWTVVGQDRKVRLVWLRLFGKCPISNQCTVMKMKGHILIKTRGTHLINTSPLVLGRGGWFTRFVIFDDALMENVCIDALFLTKHFQQ